MPTEEPIINQARSRLLQVFRYLQALNQHRNPVTRTVRQQEWALWFRDLPSHPAVRVGNLAEQTEGDEGASRPDDPAGEGADFILAVKRPRLTSAPQPPDIIEEWLEQGWKNPDKTATYRTSRNETDAEGRTRVVRFEDDPEGMRAFESWQSLREMWAENERPAREAMALFEKLYELRGRLEREGERLELVLGDGVLAWRRQEGDIHHPVLLQRLQLEFRPDVPEFVLSPSDGQPELYTALFQSMTDIDPKAIGACRKELDEGGYLPLGGKDTSGFLRRFAIALSPQGRFVEEGEPRIEEHPSIRRSPVIFLRRRTLGFATAIEAILEDISERTDFPESLLGVVGLTPPAPTVSIGDPGYENELETEDVLFSKPANQEQLRIARLLERHGSVLVQGPPGTGKTHTIGNLIGHFLAQGKSVLVTAHTPKALRVLRGHVVDALRPLCVSVLDRDTESREQLREAVESIAERLSTSDAGRLAAGAEKLAAERNSLLSALRRARQRLHDARAGEYVAIAVGGESYPPSKAARKVAHEERVHGWIPGPLDPGAALPISEAECLELYRTNHSLSPEDELELGAVGISPTDLPSPAEFSQLIEKRAQLLRQDTADEHQYWDRGPAREDVARIDWLTQRLKDMVPHLAAQEPWKLAAIEAGRRGDPHNGVWERLLDLIEDVRREAATAQEHLLNHQPALSSVIPLDEQEVILNEIISHLEAGGSLSFVTLLTRGRWKRLLREAKCGGREPSSAEEFRALAACLRVERGRQQLANWWDQLLNPLGAPTAAELGHPLEEICAQFAPPLQLCLKWQEEFWTQVESALRDLGLRWELVLAQEPPRLVAHGELLRLLNVLTGRLPALLTSRLEAIELQDVEAQLSALRSRLVLAAANGLSAGVVAALREAVDRHDPVAYEQAFGRLVDLDAKRHDLERRRGLLEKIGAVAPTWATAIRSRSGIHGQGQPPGDVREAWLWRQLHEELERRGKIQFAELQEEIRGLRRKFRETTIRLIDRRAWAAQARRTTPQQRQALQGWLQTVRRGGKWTGIRAPKLQAEARRKMVECRSAVPVWIMPLARVVENYDPRKTRFDVAIIDEASQLDSLGLLAFYLGRQVLVVGDLEQVTPDAVGEKYAAVQHLIAEHLEGIPNSHLYDGQQSVYELAGRSFEAPVMLTEHFRCVPDIIEFSNYLSYHGKIKPLRDSSSIRLKPHVVGYRVRGAVVVGKVNAAEARAVASLLVAATEQPEYEGKSMGVITLVGEAQAVETDRLLRRYLSPQEFERRRIVCGNAAQFQGDERDVMFLSMVDTAEGGLLRMRSEDRYRRRFNVAASRACDQMWVVHSHDIDDLQPQDLRRLLLEHTQDPWAKKRALETAAERAESDFEKEVLRILGEAGYRVRSQCPAGHYRIDIVVEGEGGRLAVECDGDRYHPLERLGEDMARQAVLERMGWTFERIRGSEFYRHPERAMRPVFERLRKIGVTPPGALSEHEERTTVSTELKERVVRRAEELRREWEEEPADQEVAPQSAQPPGGSPTTSSTPRPVQREGGQTRRSSTTEQSVAGKRSSTPPPVTPTASGRGESRKGVGADRRGSYRNPAGFGQVPLGFGSSDRGFQAGARVRHQAFGVGTVLRVLGDHKLEVAFDRAGTKQIHLGFTQLEEIKH